RGRYASHIDIPADLARRCARSSSSSARSGFPPAQDAGPGGEFAARGDIGRPRRDLEGGGLGSRGDSQVSATRTPQLTAEVLRGASLADLQFRTVAGESGFSRPISWGRIQRPGLAFAGFLAFIKPGRIQILGESELNYLDTMPADVRVERIGSICALPVAAFVVTKGQKVPEDLARECRAREVPLLVSKQTTSVVIQSITRVLEDELAPSTTVHGVLVDVYGMGVLLLGDSGIGKSECALDLIQRGHRLVADDVVEIRKYPNGSLVGRAAEMIRYHMELRGIGIINIKHLFGVSAVRMSKSIELVIELERWDPTKKYDRLGLDG